MQKTAFVEMLKIFTLLKHDTLSAKLLKQRYITCLTPLQGDV